MKKIMFTIFIIHCSFLIANAQWIQQYTGTTTDFHSVKFLNRYTGWACGTGTILKTTNGGVNWVAQTHPATSKRLASLCIVDSLNLYCVGWYETILKTTDGGLNWTAIRNGPGGTGSSYDACFFINKNTGWIGGSGQKIWKTTNSCDSLMYIYVDAGYIYDIYFKDSLTGLMCGDAGLLKRTIDGGNNWYVPNIQLHYIGYPFDKITIINNQYCWIIGESRYPVYRSTDFGENWDSIGCVTNAFEIYTTRFSSENTGWCGGGGTPAGRMFKTTNGGFTWQQYDNTISCYFGDFWFHNDGVGWAVGSNGVILNTTNGGISYVNQLSSNIPENFKLYQNFPNPFNSVSSIKYQVLKSSNIKLIVFNILGKEVATLVNEKQTPGIYEVHFDGGSLSTGIYFYSLLVDGKIIDTKKLVLLK